MGKNEAPPSSRKKTKLATFKAGRLAQRALAFTKEVLAQSGPRKSGSLAALEAAELIKSELETTCDTVESQQVPIDSKINTRLFTLVVYTYPAVVLLCLVGLPYLGLLLSALVLWFSFETFGRYKPRYLAPTDMGVNVHGIIEPVKAVESTIIFTAHHDSAPIERFEKKKAMIPFGLVGGAALLSFLQTAVELTQLRLFRPNFPPILLFLLGLGLLGGLYYVRTLLEYYTDEVAPGAGDNLISVGILAALAQYFKAEPLSKTRIILASFDGEEIFLQGSTAWYEAHKDALEGAVVLNFDSIFSAEHLVFLERDANATLPLSKSLARKCVNIARSMGYEASALSMPILGGATDAASAARIGLEATTLTASSWSDGVYHTKDDTLAAIDPESVERSIGIAIRLARLIEQDSLWDDELPIEEEKVEEPTNPTLVFSKLTRR
ncbi:MAG TPA: M28 family peptidase [Sphaerochaeta sp.]|nr:M28 family peptidase [Sphaerochaeta sp.]